MKKKLLVILATGICATTALIAGPLALHFSADAHSDGALNNSGGTCIYADADKDRNCDACGKNFVDEDGDGVCDNHGTGHCQNKGDKNFVDEDGDGVCDNLGSGHCQNKGDKNFVDEDGDGVCDNLGSGHCYGKRGSHGGHGNGHRGGCGK